VIATDRGTITRVQGVGFSSPKTRVVTDSWLSIAGAGCGLTGVGAGEEQARKVVAGEASWCGEDK
jgi:hypothetical protein